MSAASRSSAYTHQFDALDVWGRTRASVSEGERARVDAILALVPEDARSIVDVGCADGLIANELFDRGRDVTGVDIVPRLLQFVRARTVEASADQLPFEDAAFDCVIAADILEHLPAGMFERTLSELERVSRRYLILCSPHREPLALMQARCARCESIFHASHHVRSFDEHDVAEWFTGFRLRELRLTGERWRYRSTRLQRAAQLFGRAWYQGPGIVCPTCDYPVIPAQPNRLLWAANGALQWLAGLLGGSRASEFVVLLERGGR